ncbi:MAG: hypothetical protein PHO17_09285, partial [Proteiniphilum sp.]|nr:hypothetical protein [Proteiniphilum sp.]
SNSRPSAWEANALPTELLPQDYPANVPKIFIRYTHHIVFYLKFERIQKNYLPLHPQIIGM